MDTEGGGGGALAGKQRGWRRGPKPRFDCSGHEQIQDPHVSNSHASSESVRLLTTCSATCSFPAMTSNAMTSVLIVNRRHFLQERSHTKTFHLPALSSLFAEYNLVFLAGLLPSSSTAAIFRTAVWFSEISCLYSTRISHCSAALYRTPLVVAPISNMTSLTYTALGTSLPRCRRSPVHTQNP